MKKYSMFPKKLPALLQDLTGPALARRGFMESRIVTEWASIVGSRIAQSCIPEKIIFPRGEKSNGTLHLLARPAAALEIQHAEPQIREKIAVYFGYNAISRICITQSFPAAQQHPKTSPAPTMRSAEAGASARAMASHITDAELHDALVSLGEAVLSTTKSY